MASAVDTLVCIGRTQCNRRCPLARPNFKYEKRQKELAKQKKNEEKRLRKLEKRNQPADDEAIGETPEETTEDSSSE